MDTKKKYLIKLLCSFVVVAFRGGIFLMRSVPFLLVFFFFFQSYSTLFSSFSSLPLPEK